MSRRPLLEAGAADWTLGAYNGYALERKTCRVGLIGTGWFGKSDLFRLIEGSRYSRADRALSLRL